MVLTYPHPHGGQGPGGHPQGGLPPPLPGGGEPGGTAPRQERGACWSGPYQGSAGNLVAAFLNDELTPQERERGGGLLDEMEV